MRSPVHHQNIRKRKGSTEDPYPHPHKWINLLDKIVMAGGVVGPAMTIPQIHKIFAYQTAAGLSLLSWMMFAILDVPWIVYGIVHKAKPVVVAYTLWFIMNTAVVIGILMYNGFP